MLGKMTNQLRKRNKGYKILTVPESGSKNL